MLYTKNALCVNVSACMTLKIVKVIRVKYKNMDAKIIWYAVYHVYMTNTLHAPVLEIQENTDLSQGYFIFTGFEENNAWEEYKNVHLYS